LPLTETKLNGQDITDKTGAVITGATVTLSGKAMPGATVVLYIHSTPRQETVKADSTGFWTVTVKGLEAGKHTVEAEVTDTTGKTSERKQIAAFTLKTTTTALASTAPKKGNRQMLVVGAVVVLLSAVGLYQWRRHRQLADTATIISLQRPQPQSPPVPPAESDSQQPKQ
jgi:hypothetical protein